MNQSSDIEINSSNRMDVQKVQPRPGAHQHQLILMEATKLEEKDTSFSLSYQLLVSKFD